MLDGLIHLDVFCGLSIQSVSNLGNGPLLACFRTLKHLLSYAIESGSLFSQLVCQCPLPQSGLCGIAITLRSSSTH